MFKTVFFAVSLFFVARCDYARAEDFIPLRVGMELSYPPFETMDHEGRPSGISVDLAKALGEYLKREILIENISFTGLIPALQTNKIDIILSSMSVTDERKRAIAFSDPYLTTGLCLLISRKSDLQTIEQANQNDRTVAVKSGTSGEVFARVHLTQANLIVLDRESAAVLEVIQGKADAFIYDQFSVYTNWQKNLSTTWAALKPFKMESWAIALRQDDNILRQQIDAFLTQFKLDGGFERLGDKYLHEQKTAFKQMGIPFVF